MARSLALKSRRAPIGLRASRPGWLGGQQNRECLLAEGRGPRWGRLERAADWVGLGKGLRAQADCARGGGWAEGKAPSAPDWLGYWTLIGRGAGKTEEFGVAARKGGRPRGS